MVGEIRDLPDRRDCHPGLADRPPGALHHPHQRRGRRDYPLGGSRSAAIPGGLVADALLAQRLVRRLCRDCCEAYRPSEEDLVSLSLDPVSFLAGQARRVRFKGEGVPPPPACSTGRVRAAVPIA